MDHIESLLAARRRISPDVPLDGMAIFGRARRLDRLSREVIEPVHARHGLDSGEFDVLASLQRAGPPYAVRPTELFRSLLITSGGLTDRLVRLEKRGLIVRERNPDDGRSLIARLTPEGLALIEAAYREDMEAEAAMLAPLSAHERGQLAALLAKLLEGVETGTQS